MTTADICGTCHQEIEWTEDLTVAVEGTVAQRFDDRTFYSTKPHGPDLCPTPGLALLLSIEQKAADWRAEAARRAANGEDEAARAALQIADALTIPKPPPAA